MAGKKSTSGGVDLLAGLGALAVGTAIKPSQKPLPPVAPDFSRLESFYVDVLNAAWDDVPQDYPDILPINDYFNYDEDCKKENTPWRWLAYYHGVSMWDVRVRYLQWCCKRDGMPFRTDVVENSILVKNRLGERQVRRDEIRDPNYVTEQRMEPNEPEPKPEPKPEPEEQVAPAAAAQEQAEQEKKPIPA